MLFSDTAFIGIDPTAGKRPIAYSALDKDLRMLALAKGDMDEVLAFIAGQNQAVVAVCSPRRPSTGVMEKPEIRDQLSPPPRPGRWTNYRLVEYQLRQLHISTYQTPANAEKCPKWMQVGFALYRRLEGLGFQNFKSGDSRHQVLEVYPHACYTVLLGSAPFQKNTLEGRLQRQLVLYEQGINVLDPMRFFEEITRHRLLKGILPDENLYTTSELDALVAAYTARMSATQHNQITLLGHPEEGQIVLPSAELKSHY